MQHNNDLIAYLPPDMKISIYLSLPIQPRINTLLSLPKCSPLTEYTECRKQLQLLSPTKVAASFEPIPDTALEDQLSVLSMDQLWHVFSNGILNKVFCPATPAITEGFDALYTSKTYNPSFDILPKSRYVINDTTNYLDSSILNLFNWIRTPFVNAPYIYIRHRMLPETIRARRNIMISHIMQSVRLFSSLHTQHPDFDYTIKKIVFDFIIGVSVYTRVRYTVMRTQRCLQIKSAITEHYAMIEFEHLRKMAILQSRMEKQAAIARMKLEKREAAKLQRKSDKEAAKLQRKIEKEAAKPARKPQQEADKPTRQSEREATKSKRQ
jgi:hypothetical protein